MTAAEAASAAGLTRGQVAEAEQDGEPDSVVRALADLYAARAPAPVARVSGGTLDQWVAACRTMASRPAEFYTGARKIHTGVMLDFGPLDASLGIGDCGFTRSKLSILRRLYWQDEHAEAVAALWRSRVAKGKYGSVSASTYHHLTKSDPERRSKRASVMGPCLVGVGLTLLGRQSTAVDLWYRTTELFKKFPADLVFVRETVLPALGVDPARVERVRCHFANVTSHPMYAVTWLATMEDPREALDQVRAADRRFFDWVVKWTGRYVCPEHHRGIAKFAQALRVQKDAMSRIGGDRLENLRTYLRENHPGYRNDYDGGTEDGDDDDQSDG